MLVGFAGASGTPSYGIQTSTGQLFLKLMPFCNGTSYHSGIRDMLRWCSKLVVQKTLSVDIIMDSFYIQFKSAVPPAYIFSAKVSIILFIHGNNSLTKDEHDYNSHCQSSFSQTSYVLLLVS
ncbi:unnamed protein product [Ambrosiozyma monospora]|uniref:Unnamed protein product n=1 Tax=Ambrosiozyma monospora TaxID=43982 RepID=A0A9W7DEQ9_AMBMO|nr:unnamed protein product [Ambrosiozyma monospora]